MKKEEKKNNKNYKNIVILIVAIILLIIVVPLILMKFINKDIKEIETEYSTFKSLNIKYKAEPMLNENNSEIILFTINNVNECNERIKLKKYEMDDKNNINIYFDAEISCGLCAPYDQTFEIPISSEYNEIIPYYRITKQEQCDDDVVYKPIIYIYPEKEMDLTIRLKNKDLLTYTYPKYNNSWNIRVNTNGNIFDYNTNRNYYALYWEAIDNSKINTNEGFIVKGQNTIEFLEEKLEYIGLNEREINEFIIYWIDKLENNKYNYIRFRTTDEINEYMPLSISEKPDTLIRVIMDYMPLEKEINVKEQKLDKVVRKGYTIVEWGGRKIDGTYTK